MKRLHFLSTILFVVLFVGCSYNELPEELGVDLPIDERISLNVETRAEVYNGEELDREYFVTATDLENFVKFRRNTSKRSNLSVKEVKSYGFDSSQTLFYILNYNDGWEVVAADKRVQPSLAHGDSGEFTMDCDNEPMKFWMNMLADGVLQTRRNNTELQSTTTSADTTTTTAITDTTTVSTTTDNPNTSSSFTSQYVDFWNTISHSDDNTRADIITPIGGPRQPIEGYLYQIDEESYVSSVEDTSPLIPTKWGQNYPWNMYCPYKSNSTTSRVPAGCVALSASQMLYFLQDKYDLSLDIPSSCTCVGSIPNYERSFSDFTNSTWDNMGEQYNYSAASLDSCRYSALLIAYVGELCNMSYGDSGSTAYTMRLPELVFSPLGINCSISDSYEYEIVRDQLIQRMPIIIRGTKPNETTGHSWIINGIRRVGTTTIKYYKLFDTEQTVFQLLQYDKEDADHSISSESIFSYLRMNWGWGGSSDENFYTLLDSFWDTGYGEAISLPYRDGVQLIYDFQPINQ